MKCLGLFLIAIFLMADPVFSQIVEIPDTAFLYALIDEGVYTNGDSLMSFLEAEVVVKIDIQDRRLPLISCTSLTDFLQLFTVVFYLNRWYDHLMHILIWV